MMKFWNWYSNNTKVQFWLSFGAASFALAVPLFIIGKTPASLTFIVAAANYCFAGWFGYQWWQEKRGTKQTS